MELILDSETLSVIIRVIIGLLLLCLFQALLAIIRAAKALDRIADMMQEQKGGK